MKRNEAFRIPIACLAFLAVFVAAYATGLAQRDKSTTQGATLELMPPVLAAQTGTTGQMDDDEQLDEKFRKFGRAAGAAYQCTPEAERENFGTDIRRAYTKISQLFGTDRAFFFAVNFGDATDEPFDKAKCSELMRKLRESVFVRGLTQ